MDTPLPLFQILQKYVKDRDGKTVGGELSESPKQPGSGQEPQ